MGHVIGRGRNARETYPLPPSSSGQSISASGLLWDPSLPSLGNRVQTWGEVFAAIEQSQAPLLIYVEAPFDEGTSRSLAVVPAGTWPLRHAIFAGAREVEGAAFVTLDDGALIVDLGGLQRHIEVGAYSNTQSSIAYSFVAPEEALGISGTLFNFGTFPMITIPDGKFLIIEVDNQGGLGDDVPGPLVSIGAGSVATVFLNNVEVGTISDTWAVGGASATIFYGGGYVPGALPTTPGFTGTTLFVAGFSFYNATTSKPAWSDGTIFRYADGSAV